MGSGCGVCALHGDEPGRQAVPMSWCAWTLSCPSSGLCFCQGAAGFGVCSVMVPVPHRAGGGSGQGGLRAMQARAPASPVLRSVL